MINSPLNYTGNKYKLLKQILPLINGKSEKFIDVFAGSGLVGLNCDSKEVILNDNNKTTVDLLNYFKNNSSKKIISEVDKIILSYGFTDTHRNGKEAYPEVKHEGLSKFNKIPFNNLKNDYNNNPALNKLFSLVIFGFDHYIRYNSKKIHFINISQF